MRPDPQWTAGRPHTAPDEGLHQTVARLASSRPEAVALVAGPCRVTYGELDRTADAWAALLAHAGVAPGDLVPILLPRSAELVTALLAVLKTGAAYALLDPRWPERRLREVVALLKAPLLVAADEAGSRLGMPVWRPPAGPVAPAPDFRPVPVRGEHPCCVFFTSGTTGEPKGVLTPHRATARLFRPGGFARFTAGTVVPLAAPTPWDAFSLELWSVLLNGGVSVVVSEPYLSAQALRDAVRSHGADTVWLTAGLFNTLVDEDPEAFTGLSQVMTGGERLSVPHVRAFLNRHPRVALLNGYGPVENTVFATTHVIGEADCDLPGGIPLGRPVPGTEVHVLDGDRPCAVGEVGEICVAGDGLALRYLGDPALTRAKFADVRVEDGRLLRVYRTGDLGEWGPDGLLHFRGRADRQVKIRGHRVEPSEVERQVERLLPSVRSCRVLPRRDASGAVRDLVAFCVPAELGDPLEDALPVLRSALVAYQCPAAVVGVESFPVTDRGKLDERALMALVPPATTSSPRSALTPAGEIPQDPILGAVAETFGTVLGRAGVPLDVPFTELGGDSLGAGRVCARLAARLSRPVPVSGLYEHPTATAFAQWLRATRAAGGIATATPPAASAASAGSVPHGPSGPVPLTPMQVVYLTRHLMDPADRTSHCLLTWVIEGPLDLAALEAAVAAAHRRHEPLRAAYLPDPRPSATPVDIPPPPLQRLPSRPTVDQAVQALREELSLDLDPAEGEVWRVAVVPVGTGHTAVFGCVVHHIAFDGWSEAVLARDLGAAYNAARGADAPAEPPPPSLAEIHAGRAAYAEHAETGRHRDRLVAELAGVPDLRWPLDPGEARPGPPGHVEVTLDVAVVRRVDALAARLGVTRFAVLLSQWAATMAEVTGQRDFAVGVPVARRDGPELERAVGCHIAVLCLRMRGSALDGGTRAVRETARIAGRALAAQDVPFTDVLRVLDPPRTGRPPLYQTLFALQDNTRPRLDLAGLTTTFVRQPYLDLPLELHAELWPDDGGGITLVVGFRPDAVGQPTARELAKRFTDRLSTLPEEGRP
ncbi:amino acid adenylation domain-containing protein [Microbispora bryophytorum]|uniref:amino acid adenylation domain-containing protein n=1 Tax=Microbispora bryophytorum TaxID=1460882 RepID=UPI003411490B